MKRIYTDGFDYINSNYELHRIGMFSCKVSKQLYWDFHGKGHRLNGFWRNGGPYCRVYNEPLYVNIGKLVI